jgi:lysine-N-methylase
MTDRKARTTTTKSENNDSSFTMGVGRTMRDTLLEKPPTTAMMQPGYSKGFRCIGPACEDSCCIGWSVTIDEETYDKYQAIPAGPLRDLIQINVAPQPPNADGTGVPRFAKVQMGADSLCPFLNAEKLCQIQVEYGEGYLSKICATYPRVVHRVDGLEEKALSLSCPEAARLVLLNPDLLGGASAGGYVLTWNEPCWDEAGEDLGRQPGENGDAAPPPTPLNRFFWPIREFVLTLLRNRDYALWQRLFLLGVFAKRLDAQARGELGRGFVAIRHGFWTAVESGTLRPTMDVIPADLLLQLEMVLRLAGMPLQRSHVGPRFLETLEAFKLGIGIGPDSGPETKVGSLVGRYAEAYGKVYEPFFRKHPYILENLLINTVFRTYFPFGDKAGKADAAPEMMREFALLATQFALMKGLLIGVAGFHGEAFSVDHVILTVQSATKHFEHHPWFLDQAYALLERTGVLDLRGLTMLLRN